MMLLSDSGADLLGVNEQKILAVLRQAKGGMHVRLLEREAGTPHYTTGGILRRFTITGLLTEQQIGTSLVYSINRHHVFWSAIETLLDARSTIISRFQTTIKPLADRGVTLAIYGSTARGDATAESAIDLALIYPDNIEYTDIEDAIHRLQDLGEQLAGNTVKVSNVDHATLDEMINVNESLLQAWLAEAETLSGPDLRDLIETRQRKHTKKSH